jgi:hypothetical protein
MIFKISGGVGFVRGMEILLLNVYFYSRTTEFNILSS